MAPVGKREADAIAASRDGLLDVFGEDSWLDRNIWYRADDRDIETVMATVER